MAKDKDYIKMIHTARWGQLRRNKITAQPLCERCKEEGRITPAAEVHHIVPVENATTLREKETLMFDPHNLRSLCHDCHVLTHIEMGRSGKAYTQRRITEQRKRFTAKFLT